MGLSIPSSEALPGVPLSCQIQPLVLTEGHRLAKREGLVQGISSMELLWALTYIQGHWGLIQTP